MILTSMRTWMTTKANITDLLDSSQAISTEKRQERTNPPYITIKLIREFPTIMSGGVSTYNQAQIEISCEHNTDIEAYTLGKAVKDTIGAFGRGLMDTTFVNAITDIDLSQRGEFLLAGKDRFPGYTLTITLDYTDS